MVCSSRHPVDTSPLGTMGWPTYLTLPLQPYLYPGLLPVPCRYLRHVEVENGSGEKVLFPCNAWLGDSECGAFQGGVAKGTHAGGRGWLRKGSLM